MGLEGAAPFGQEVAALLHVRQQPDRQTAGLPGEHAQENGCQRASHQVELAAFGRFVTGQLTHYFFMSPSLFKHGCAIQFELSWVPVNFKIHQSSRPLLNEVPGPILKVQRSKSIKFVTGRQTASIRAKIPVSSKFTLKQILIAVRESYFKLRNNWFRVR